MLFLQRVCGLPNSQPPVSLGKSEEGKLQGRRSDLITQSPQGPCPCRSVQREGKERSERMQERLPPRQDGLRRSKIGDAWFSEAPRFLLLEQRRYWRSPLSPGLGAGKSRPEGPRRGSQGGHPHFTCLLLPTGSSPKRGQGEGSSAPS